MVDPLATELLGLQVWAEPVVDVGCTVFKVVWALSVAEAAATIVPDAADLLRSTSFATFLAVVLAVESHPFERESLERSAV